MSPMQVEENIKSLNYLRGKIVNNTTFIKCLKILRELE
jgi:hypothetical protein